MLCPHCKREFSDGDRFCRHCGSGIPGGAAVPAEAARSDATAAGVESEEIDLEDLGDTGGKPSKTFDDGLAAPTGGGSGAWIGATVVVFLVFIALMVPGWLNLSCEGSGTSDEGPGYTERERLAWRAVYSHLKAPATASLRLCKESYRNPVNDRGLVLVAVDAENSFGAMIRTCFYVVFIPGEKLHIDKVSCPPTEFENHLIFATYGLGEGDE